MWEPPQETQDQIREMGPVAEDLFKQASAGALAQFALILHCMQLKGSKGCDAAIELERLLTEFGRRHFAAR